MNNIHYPNNTFEAAELIGAAAQERRPVIPGGGFKRLSDPKGWPDHNLEFISTLNFANQLEAAPENLAVKAGAGITVTQLESFLADGNLYWPVTGPHIQNRTLGALFAEGLMGLEAARFGRPVDYLLGAEFITPGGLFIKTGGQTIKNVSGYDLTRLHWRSYGTLGLMTAFTLKLVPKPQTSLWALVYLASPEDGVDLAEKMILNQAGFETLRLIHTKANGWRLLTGFQGFDKSVGPRFEAFTNAAKAKGLRFDVFNSNAFLMDNPPLTCSSRQLIARGGRRALLKMTHHFKTISGDFYLDADLGGGLLYYGEKDFLNPDSGLTQDDLTASGQVYRQVKNVLDPLNLFFPDKYFTN